MHLPCYWSGRKLQGSSQQVNRIFEAVGTANLDLAVMPVFAVGPLCGKLFMQATELTTAISE